MSDSVNTYQLSPQYNNLSYNTAEVPSNTSFGNCDEYLSFPSKLLLNERDCSVVAGRLSAPGAPPKCPKEVKHHFGLIKQHQQRERRLMEKQAKELKKKRANLEQQTKEWVARLRPIIGEQHHSVLEKGNLKQLSINPQVSHAIPLPTAHITLDDTKKFNKLIRGSKTMRHLWAKGLPPSVIANVWKYAIGNPCEISTEMYLLCKAKVVKRKANAECGIGSVMDTGTNYAKDWDTNDNSNGFSSLQKENDQFHRLLGTGAYGSDKLLYGDTRSIQSHNESDAQNNLNQTLDSEQPNHTCTSNENNNISIVYNYGRPQYWSDSKVNSHISDTYGQSVEPIARYTASPLFPHLTDKIISDRAIEVDLPRTVITHKTKGIRSPLPHTTIGTPVFSHIAPLQSVRESHTSAPAGPLSIAGTCISIENSPSSCWSFSSHCPTIQISDTTKSITECDISAGVSDDSTESRIELNSIGLGDGHLVASNNLYEAIHEQNAKLSELLSSYEDSFHQYSNEDLTKRPEQQSPQTTHHEHTVTHNICDDSRLIARVSDLLKLFVEYRPDIGYVQGMSYLAAMILIHIDNDEEAFVCLANLILNTGHFRHFYTFNHVGMCSHFSVFEEVLARGLPALHSHFKVIGVTPQMYIFNWWITLFSRTFSYEIATRVWSLFLLDDAYLYRISICILHYFSHIIHEKCPMDEILVMFSKIDQYTIDEERLFGIIVNASKYPPSISDIRVIMNKLLSREL